MQEIPGENGIMLMDRKTQGEAEMTAPEVSIGKGVKLRAGKEDAPQLYLFIGGTHCTDLLLNLDLNKLYHS